MFFGTTYDYNTEEWGTEQISRASFETYCEYRLDEKGNHSFIYVGF